MLVCLALIAMGAVMLFAPSFWIRWQNRMVRAFSRNMYPYFKDYSLLTRGQRIETRIAGVCALVAGIWCFADVLRGR